MANEGSEQIRMKSEKEIQIDILNIQREISKLDDKKITDQIEFLKGQNQIRDRFNKLIDIQKKKQTEKIKLEKDLISISKKQHTGDEGFEAAIRAEYEKTEGLLEQKSLEIKMLEAITSIREDEIKGLEKKFNIQERLAEEARKQAEEQKAFEEQQLDKSINFLSKFGDIFKIQGKHYKALTDILKIEASRAIIASAYLAVI